MEIDFKEDTMHSCWLLWISIILIHSSFMINGGIFQDLPEMKIDKSKVLLVNDTVTISCKIESNKNIFLYLNKTLLLTNVTEINYPFRSERPGVNIFFCYCDKASQNWIEITYRYAPRVRSVKTLITGLNSCHMKVEFVLEYFTRKDYIVINRYDDEKKSFCSKNNVCDFQCHLFETYMLQVLLSSIGLDVSTYNTTINASSDFYKLDKMKLTISAKGSESLNLTYGNTNENITKLQNDKQFPNSLYRIFYKSEWDQIQKIITTDKTEIQLENLIPYSIYTIHLQAKLKGSRYWSDNVTLEERTLSSAPYAGPNSTNGSYLETTCAEKSKRCFILFWAMIPMPLRNGIFYRYVIQQDNRTLFKTSEIYGEINDQPQYKDLWFEIRAQNNNSQLSPPTVIHIPPKAPKKPKGVSVVWPNNAPLSISWALEQSLKNVTVTVMSCHSEKDNPSSWCKSDVMWTKIQNKNFTILEAEGATNFLVAAYVSNSEGSSSLTFAECILSGGISKPPLMPIIQEYPYQLSFSWPKFSCKDLNGRPTVFQVLYAEGNSCKNGSEGNISAIGTRPETEKIEIKNLKPFTKYSVCLRIQTEQGWSILSPQRNKSTAETNPSRSVRNLKVVSSTSSSVTLKWDPTLKPNGIITHQFVYYDKVKIYSISPNMTTISDLNSSTKYNFSVSTCNKGGCSEKSSSVIAKTSKDKRLILLISFSMISGIIFLIICTFFSRWLKKKYDKINVDIVLPDEGCKNDFRALPKPPNYPDKIIDSNPNWTMNGHTSRDYVTIDSDSQTELIGCENGICSSAKDTQQLMSLAKVSQNSNSKEALKMANLHGNESHLQRELPPTRFCPANLDSDDYVRQGNINMLNNIIPSDLSQTDSDSNAYMTINMNSFDLSQTDSDGYVSNKINSSELSQTDSDGYVSNKINSTELNLENQDSNHILPKLGQASLDSNGYVSNNMNSSDLSQTDSDGYVSNKINSSELNLENQDSNHILPKLGQASLDSNGYVSNNMNSSDLSQTDSDGYVSNKINSSELNLENQDSNHILPKLGQASLDSNGYVSNNMNSSDLSQTDSDGYVSNKINSSELNLENQDSNHILPKLGQASLDSNGYVSNNMNSSDLSQTDSDGYVSNKINSSELNLENQDSNHILPKLGQASLDSNGYVSNNINLYDLSQTYSDSNVYV